MATTFDPSLTDNLSRVRFKIGDVGDGQGGFDPVLYAAELQDETIQALLTQCGDVVISASIVAARSLMAKYAKMVDVDVDNQLTRASQRYAQYKNLVAQLEDEASSGSGPPPATGAYSGGPIVTGLDDTRGPLDPPAWPYLPNGMLPP